MLILSTALALLAVAPTALAQGVLGSIAPDAAPPAGCVSSSTGVFGISAVKLGTKKRSLERRDCPSNDLLMSLSNGILTAPNGHTGYIASNYQFQFDGPPQAGAIYTAGFSLCGNGSLALGGSAIFWQCLSGSFANLYDRDWAAQCSPVTFDTFPCTNIAPASNPANTQSVSTATSGGPEASSAAASATTTGASGSGSASASTPTITSAGSLPSSGVVIGTGSNGQPQVSTTAGTFSNGTTTGGSAAPTTILTSLSGSGTATVAGTATGSATGSATPSASKSAADAVAFGVKPFALMMAAVLALF